MHRASRRGVLEAPVEDACDREQRVQMPEHHFDRVAPHVEQPSTPCAKNVATKKVATLWRHPATDFANESGENWAIRADIGQHTL
jgi:hypothetical protein